MILSSFSKFDIRITKIPAGERHPDLTSLCMARDWLVSLGAVDRYLVSFSCSCVLVSVVG